eukprot:1930200-Prymnesium_polylepis.2
MLHLRPARFTLRLHLPATRSTSASATDPCPLPTLRLLPRLSPSVQAVLASLGRPHVVSLFNLLGRLSHSVEVARVVVPLLGAAHSTCSPRGCKASEYEVDADDDHDAPGVGPPPPDPRLDPFGAMMMAQ